MTNQGSVNVTENDDTLNGEIKVKITPITPEEVLKLLKRDAENSTDSVEITPSSGVGRQLTFEDWLQEHDLHLEASPPPPPQPPEFASWLICLLPRDQREGVMGDLQEDFARAHMAHGRRRAIFLYYRDLIANFWPYVGRWVDKLIELALAAWFSEVIRRLIP